MHLHFTLRKVFALLLTNIPSSYSCQKVFSVEMYRQNSHAHLCRCSDERVKRTSKEIHLHVVWVNQEMKPPMTLSTQRIEWKYTMKLDVS